MPSPREYIAAADLLDELSPGESEEILGAGGLSGASQEQLDALMRAAVGASAQAFIQSALDASA